MTQPSKLFNRRNVLIGQACALGLAGTAAAQSGPLTGGFSLPYAPQLPPTWETVTNTEMVAFKKEHFWGRTEDGTSVRLRLYKTEAVNSGPARPSHLKRKEGVIALFTSRQTPWFIENGPQNILMGHEVLGHATVHISASRRRNGKYFLEVVLN